MIRQRAVVSSGPSERSIWFLVLLSLPALSLALAYAINKPALYHFVLSDLVDHGKLDEARLNTALGLVGIFGLSISGIAQPIIGILSDHTRSRVGRRYPYMLTGAIGLIVAFSVMVNAPNIFVLLVGVLLLQSLLSMIQSPLNALLPDQVGSQQMGLAAGFKTVMELVGIVVAGGLTWAFLGNHQMPNAAILVISGLTITSVVVTFWRAPEPAARMKSNQPITATRRFMRMYYPSADWLTSQRVIVVLNLRRLARQTSFLWWLVHRFSFFISFNILGSFALTYLEDVIGLSEQEARETQGRIVIMIAFAVMLVTIPAGMISDRIGRRRMLMVAGMMAAISTVTITLTTSLNVASFLLMFTGVGSAIFFSVGWALVTAIVPQRQTAFYLGITNIATSMGSSVGLSSGFIVDEVNRRTDSTNGYNVILIIAAGCFLLSALAIQQIREKRLPKSALAVEMTPAASD
ncbi:MAG: MFS transporter [Chloroflexota bacterium]|nr:MAG: MFS transporter [Chloroflexota bacterium]